MIFSHQAEPIALPDGNTDFMRSKFFASGDSAFGV
jgi:hypothetical protein